MNYYSELDRAIYYITKENIENNNFNIRLLEDKWFIDKHYKEEINFKQGE